MSKVGATPRLIARWLPWSLRRRILLLMGRSLPEPRASVDPSGFNPAYVGPRPELVKRLPPDRTSVLDLGCATGEVGVSVKQRFPGARVVGVELDPVMAEAASARIDRVIVANLDDAGALRRELDGCRFDGAIAGDILEHLVNPWAALRVVNEVLTPGAVIVASLPNIGFWDTWWNALVRRRWPYRPRGIHDSTHLRFFALRNIVPLFEQAGFEVERIDRTYRLIERPHRWNARAHWFAIPGFRDLLTFQFLIVARRGPDGPDDQSREAAVSRELLPPHGSG